jgi:hypothetical protein
MWTGWIPPTFMSTGKIFYPSLESIILDHVNLPVASQVIPPQTKKIISHFIWRFCLLKQLELVQCNILQLKVVTESAFDRDNIKQYLFMRIKEMREVKQKGEKNVLDAQQVGNVFCSFNF